MAEGCGWAYKILPFIEQSALYNNWNFTTAIKTLLDPGRSGGTALAVDTYDPTRSYANSADRFDNGIAKAGPVTDYAANAMVIGSGQNTTSSGTGVNSGAWNSSNPKDWTRYGRRIETIPDGSSNTILLGTKAMATQVYDSRGNGKFTMSNGATRNKMDDPITRAGIWGVNDGNMGTVRAWGPDTIDWMAGTSPGTTVYTDRFPGDTYTINTSHRSWLRFTFEVVQDRPDLDAFNRWGGPYGGGALFGMSDGSVRTIRHGTGHQILIPALTAGGGETLALD
jgi:hypothetical protein